MKVSYFQCFNWNRSCLNEGILEADFSTYTHIHLAFAAITPDFQVDVSGIAEQFDMLLQVPNVRHILSFRGSAFSTDPSTYISFVKQ